MKKVIAIVFLISIVGCKNDTNKIEKKYYSSRHLMSTKEIGKNGYEEYILYYDTIKDLPYLKVYRNIDHDSIVYYYKNGKMYKTGIQDFKKRKFGNWYRYTNEGYLSEIREYFIVKDDYLLNRQWYLSKKGDTLWYANKFNKYDQKEFANDTLEFRNSSMIRFDFYSKDTIKINEPFSASVICNSPLFRDYNSQIKMILGKEKDNFNKDFSNEKGVKVDTFFNLNRDNLNKVNFPKANPNYVVVFGRWFDSPGNKVLRGYMYEYFSRLPTKSDSVVKGERKVYFEKTVFVKE